MHTLLSKTAHNSYYGYAYLGYFYSAGRLCCGLSGDRGL